MPWKRGPVGVGTATHRYRDDGVYTVAATVCDDRDACTTARSTVTVRNVAPTIDASEGGTVTAGEPYSFTGTYGDAGTADTHTGSVTWGDGSSGSFTPQVGDAPGAGTFAVVHTFTTVGDATVRMCVTDDDGARTCTERVVTVQAAPVDPTDPPTDPTDPTDPTVPTDPAMPTVPGTTSTTMVPTIGHQAAPGPGSAAPDGPPALPTTGAATGNLRVLGLLLVAAGVVVVVVERRHRRRPAR